MQKHYYFKMLGFILEKLGIMEGIVASIIAELLGFANQTYLSQLAPSPLRGPEFDLGWCVSKIEKD